MHMLDHLAKLPNGRPNFYCSGVSPYPWRVKYCGRSCKAVKRKTPRKQKQVSMSAFGQMKASVINAKQYGDTTGAKTWRKVKRKREAEVRRTSQC
jgi:hypothetical protein